MNKPFYFKKNDIWIGKNDAGYFVNLRDNHHIEEINGKPTQTFCTHEEKERSLSDVFDFLTSFGDDFYSRGIRIKFDKSVVEIYEKEAITRVVKKLEEVYIEKSRLLEKIESAKNSLK